MDENAMDVEKAKFLEKLTKDRRRNAVAIGVGLGIWLLLVLFASAEEKANSRGYTDLQFFGDLALLLVFALALRTPWTARQREALARKQAQRLQRDA